MRVLRRTMSSLRRTWTQFSQTNPRLVWTLSALTWLPMGIVFNQNIGTAMVVTGRSMQPTLNPDDSKWRDVVLFDRFSSRTLHKYERGDIVALKSPIDSKLLVKRIVGLPGDVVKTLPPYPDGEVTLGPGHIWVEGDEPFHSEDSNHFGPIPMGLVDSKLSYIFWPPERFGPIEKPAHPDPKAKRGQTWRKEMNDFERERRRQARVIAASPS